MSYLPDIYKHFERAFPTVHTAHQELARRCYEVGPLDDRSARLVKLGIAIGAQAEGAVRSHARRYGLTVTALLELLPVEANVDGDRRSPVPVEYPTVEKLPTLPCPRARDAR